MSAKFLIVPEGAKGELAALGALTTQELERLEGALQDRKLLGSGVRTFEVVADALGISQDVALKIVNAVGNLRRQRENFKLTAPQLRADVDAVFSDASDGQRAALTELLAKSEGDSFVHRAALVQHALHPHLVDARSIVEARPVFSRDRSGIEAMLIITSLELSVHDPGADEVRMEVVQLTLKDIEKLEEVLREARTKDSTLRSSLDKFDVV